jgi:hypothetical protein
MILTGTKLPRKGGRKLLKFAVLGLVLVIVLFYTFICIVPLVVAEFQLWQHAREVFSWPLPPNTQKIDQSAVFIPPHTSICNSEVDLVLITRLSLEEIVAYYEENYDLRPGILEGVFSNGLTENGGLIVTVKVWGRVRSNDIRC